jgi:lipoprotein NlpI
MSRWWFCGLLWFVLGPGGAYAAGYDDFAQGLSAVNRGDNDRAIALFTSALAAGDLNPSLVPVAYLDRARAQIGKGDCAAAIADLTAALKLKTDYLDAMMARAHAERCAGDYSSAIADYSQTLTLKPTADVYWWRGLARWDAADFEGAANDFSTMAAASPKWSYPVLWFALSRLRTNTYDAGEVAKKTDSLDLDAWPGPLFGLISGKSKPDDIFRQAGDDDAQKAKDDLCEAKFYVAEWRLVQKDVTEAKALLEEARATCRHDFIEYDAANIELKRLK